MIGLAGGTGSGKTTIAQRIAASVPAAQVALIELLAHADPGDGPPAAGADEIRAMLAEVRARGYALRDPRVRPESSTIAVPIFEGPRVVATIGLTWFSSALDVEQAVARFLPPLRQASSDISRALSTTAS